MATTEKKAAKPAKGGGQPQQQSKSKKGEKKAAEFHPFVRPPLWRVPSKPPECEWSRFFAYRF